MTLKRKEQAHKQGPFLAMWEVIAQLRHTGASWQLVGGSRWWGAAAPFSKVIKTFWQLQQELAGSQEGVLIWLILRAMIKLTLWHST